MYMLGRSRTCSRSLRYLSWPAPYSASALGLGELVAAQVGGDRLGRLAGSGRIGIRLRVGRHDVWVPLSVVSGQLSVVSCRSLPRGRAGDQGPLSLRGGDRKRYPGRGPCRLRLPSRPAVKDFTLSDPGCHGRNDARSSGPGEKRGKRLPAVGAETAQAAGISSQGGF